MKRLYSPLLLLFIFVLTSCGGKTADKSVVNTSTESKSTEVMSFDSPNIPIVFTTPEDRGGFLAKHYWDNLNIADTILTYNKAMIEQKWVDYIDLLTHFAQDDFAVLLKEFFIKLQANNKLYAEFSELTHKYLYLKDSPFQNDMYLVPIYEAMLEQKDLDMVVAEDIKFKLNVASKNNPGSVAQDFSYTKIEGGIGQLSKHKKENTLVFIFNPECQFCLRDAKILSESAIVNELVKAKKIDVIAVCVEEGVESWKEHIADWPKTWIHGYDTNQDITNKHLYDLRAFPSFYLLDKDKKVILKDRPLGEVINMLSNL